MFYRTLRSTPIGVKISETILEEMKEIKIKLLVPGLQILRPMTHARLRHHRQGARSWVPSYKT